MGYCVFAKMKRNMVGFSLIELIVSMVVLGIILTGAFFAFQNFSSFSSQSKDAIVAEDIISNEFERVKDTIDRNPALYDSLSSTSDAGWVNVQDPSYPAGYYQRWITYTPNQPQPGLTQAHVRLQWTDQRGQVQQAQRVFALSQPSNFALGNIVGRVLDCSNQNSPVPLHNATVQVTAVPAGAGWILNHNVKTSASGNFTFRQNNANTLPIGSGYRLTVKGPGTQFMDTVHPPAGQPALTVPTRPDVQAGNICMYPGQATISGRLMWNDNGTKKPIRYKYVSLYRNTTMVAYSYISNSQGSFSFTLDSNQLPLNTTRCFTVATGYNMNKSTFPSYHTSASAGYLGVYCGQNFYQGWSSASMGVLPGSPICSPDPDIAYWRGNSTTEAEKDAGNNPTRSACLQLGDTVTLQDIVLQPLPNKVNLTVYVTMPSVASLPALKAEVQWPDGSAYQSNIKDFILESQTQNTKTYKRVIQVPRLYAFYDVHNMRVKADTTMESGGCCGWEAVTKSIDSGWVNANITSEANTVNLTIEACDCALCGDAFGRITDLLTGDGICGTATVAGIDFGSCSGGNWQAKCCTAGGCPDPEKGRLPRGLQSVTLSSGNSYYLRCTCGSDSFPYANLLPKINIQGNTSSTPPYNPTFSPAPYNFGLYPKGRGTVIGKVVNKSGNPLINATIKLRAYRANGTNNYGEADKTVSTDSDGNFIILGAVESWPPNNNWNSIPEPAKSQMKNIIKRHTVEITALSPTGQPHTISRTPVSVNAGQTTDLGIIVVEFPAGT